MSDHEKSPCKSEPSEPEITEVTVISSEDEPSAGNKRKARPIKTTTSKKERRRTENINAAFAELRKHIPNVPSDTKLSKIKTLQLAMSYIHHLELQLSGEESRVVIVKHVTPSEPQPVIRTREREPSIEYDLPSSPERAYEEVDEPRSGRRSSRTGWPQHVWALELVHGNKKQSKTTMARHQIVT
uniref:BHLH transcription factor Hand-2 n=1 Tax=Nematostella vectensis TaxID=45351 RepID=A0A1T4JH02_NEMVE|nr:bHLH transcription factor Hand-2 [Nematostella vectensis]